MSRDGDELEAVAEGMPGIRRSRGATHAEQQEKLVAAVDFVEWIASLSIAALPVRPG